jgi:hypothetical protein
MTNRKSTRIRCVQDAKLAAHLGALAVLAASGAALAAPDVIVGDLPNISNYTTGGPITVASYGGQSNVALRAYAIGTTSCNLGTTPLTWIDEGTSVLYPVISQNLYRLSNGRFEQIGQSWLKHGFCALNGTVCGTCSSQSNPACDFLMPGCSDPYGSSLNGSQGGLGPKREVNAATGAFPSNWNGASVPLSGDSSGALTKRLIVRDSDLTTPGAQYFVSSHYVHPEDAVAGTDDNNQSYRTVTIGDAPARNLNLTSTTQRGKAAIYAWKELGTTSTADDDAGVSINPVDVAGDGRFLVGAKVIDLGSGNYRYEYAIQNYNSDRAGRSFRVPLPAGAIVTNTSFTDVEYANDPSGTGYDGTNWTVSTSGGFVTFEATQAYPGGPNPNALPTNALANALRWDTIYSFSFTTNVAPTTGLAEIGLFKPGTGDAAIVTTSIPSGAVVPFTPPNDNCASAIQIGPGATSFSTVNATTDGPNEGGICLGSGDGHINKDVWFRVTNGDCAGDMTITTCGSSFDTKIAIYPDSCPSSIGTLIACNDDFNCDGLAGDELQSGLTFAAAANASYLVRVGGYTNSSAVTAEGSGTINATFPVCAPPPPPPPPANDLCVDAIAVADGAPVSGSTTLANNAAGDGVSIGSPCGASGSSKDVWFKYTPQTSGTVLLSTCGSSYDTVLSVHTACGTAAAQCNDDHGQGSGFCAANLSSRISMSMTAGVTYLVRVSGYNGASGNFTLTVTGGGGVVPPANDNCGNRAGIGTGITAFSTVGATTDGIAHASCNANGSNNVTNDVWFNFPSDCDGDLTISTCNDATFNTRIAVYNAQGCSDYEARLLACSDDSNECASGTTTLTIPVVSGQNYTIRVGGHNGATGIGNLSITCTPASSCPACAADYDDNGGVDGGDLAAFFADFEAGAECADVDGNGGVDGGDLATFFGLFEAGGC